ncbi:class I SAM-dependent methyltransferase [Gracilimonas sp.]|uniref:class I SAM-dependent methyltransferase n=1 Tax=Gracilimonas sp. TaxID=1974203 RepID=UPI003BABCAA3
MSDIQVQPDHYSDLSYDSKERFISYWHQIKQIKDSGCNTALEIGVGNGFVSDYLKNKGFDITTFDIDERLNPDIVGSVLNLPFKENEFELITCFEVLEHLPYEDVTLALTQLKKVASKKVIISLPDRTLTYKFLVKLPIIKLKSFMISIPDFLVKEHKFDGQHYWELGKKGYSVADFKKLLRNMGFDIIKSYQIFEVPSHHFFVLEL